MRENRRCRQLVAIVTGAVSGTGRAIAIRFGEGTLLVNNAAIVQADKIAQTAAVLASQAAKSTAGKRLVRNGEM